MWRRGAVTNRLSHALYQRGWSDQTLARVTGLSRPRINGIKNRRVKPTVRDALLISNALRVPVEQLFSLVGEQDDVPHGEGPL
jgi:transcriptional regulator with XRE-family HTH domain